jgi:hypothetical protein
LFHESEDAVRAARSLLFRTWARPGEAFGKFGPLGAAIRFGAISIRSANLSTFTSAFLATLWLIVLSSFRKLPIDEIFHAGIKWLHRLFLLCLIDPAVYCHFGSGGYVNAKI